jgi:imidazolonepropionase-like amidohydrolase
MGSSLGKVRAGYRADLLLLDGDPLSSNTSIRQVIAGGKIVFDVEGGQ